MNTKNKWRIGLILFVSTLCCLNYFMTEIHTRENFSTFNSAKLNGKISYLRSSKSGEGFILEDSRKMYTIVSIRSSLNDFNRFGNVAEVGDSLSKPSFYDTLFLFKKNSMKIYAFTFNKFP